MHHEKISDIHLQFRQTSVGTIPIIDLYYLKQP